ncbi:uncharacterized protein B0I36DRAFT_358588 [Microdochium trichocladiopsis]|uniref:Uncharacterized protein n=1 Tax=Microdochium trichocladiopsis TaxID=1682393 RepID=A0A9P9BXB2_9PEZI|nr:uncharacterized protein B0I36DRAFT_358588 [Microdochium trichocladiopsis]KAH7041415.1 hypothetical protein B0I36DRAFT_358588 [Microdochium trichocladiopsis]
MHGRKEEAKLPLDRLRFTENVQNGTTELESLCGSVGWAFLLYLAAGLGTIRNPDQDEVNTVVASFMLLPTLIRFAATNNAFLTGAEMGGAHLIKEIMASTETVSNHSHSLHCEDIAMVN